MKQEGGANQEKETLATFSSSPNLAAFFFFFFSSNEIQTIDFRWFTEAH